MRRRTVVFFLLFCILIGLSGCKNEQKPEEKEPTFSQIDVWGVKIVLPDGCETEETVIDKVETKYFYPITDSEFKKDDYLILQKDVIVTDDPSSLLLKEADAKLHEKVSEIKNIQTDIEWLSKKEFVYQSIPGIRYSACDDDYNYSIYYFLNTDGSMITSTHIHKKDGKESSLTYYYDNMMNSLDFGSFFKFTDDVEPTPSQYHKHETCVNCGGLGYVKSYYGESWLEAFLAGEPDYQLIKCPLCNGKGKY